MSDTLLPNRSHYYVSVRHIFVSLNSFKVIPKPKRVLHKNFLLTES